MTLLVRMAASDDGWYLGYVFVDEVGECSIHVADIDDMLAGKVNLLFIVLF